MSFPTWRERLDHDRRMSLPQCPECGMRTTHKVDCSQHDLSDVERRWYAENQQRKDYRDSVRDLGCTCHWRMPPHAHSLTCPLYRTEDEWSEHLQVEHEDDR